jgi:hypothetical protein
MASVMLAKTTAWALLFIASVFGCDRDAGQTAPATSRTAPSSTHPGSTTEPTSRAADQLDVIEAVFRHLFDQNNSGGRRDVECFFLSLGKDGDPPPELLARFSNETPKVLPQSMADSSAAGGVRQKGSDGRAMILSVGPVTWLDENSAEVGGGWYVGPLASVGYTYRVTRVNGKWSVTSSQMIAVS